MTSCRQSFATLGCLISLASCVTSDPMPPEPEPPWYGRTRGGALVLSRDERVAVMTARSAGVVTVFELDPGEPLAHRVVGRTDLELPEGSEPWAAVIGEDGETAYVITRRDRQLVRVDDLRGAPRLHETALELGSEPTAIVLAPSGDRLFVANWGEGTISIVTTPDFRARGKIDLNAALVQTGVLGAIEPRLGLAHPRALALTDDGDDDDGDETLYATEFFSMPKLDAGDSRAPGYFDRNRQGFVYPIAFGTDTTVGEPIALAPVADTGNPDSNGAPTGCFPNQLYAAAVDGERLFVTAMCASPAGPLSVPPAPPDVDPPPPPNTANFKTVMHPAVFVIDTRSHAELPDQRVVLTTALDQLYAQDPEAEVRMPLIPNDLVFSAPEDTAHSRAHVGCISAFGADAVFCLRFDDQGRLLDIGERGKRFIDLAPKTQRAARLPIGVAIGSQSGMALAGSDAMQTLSVVDLAENEVVVREDPIDLPRARAVRDSDAASGRRLFATGLGAWSFQGQARVSCEGCHPDGLSDGVTWFFTRGPRRTLSAAGTYYGEGDRRVLLWGGNVDEIHDVEVIARSVAGGVGGVLWSYPLAAPTNGLRIVYDGSPVPPAPGKPSTLLRNNLNASVSGLLEEPPPSEAFCDTESTTCDRSPVHEWDEIEAYVKTVRAPARPTGLDQASVERGAELFRAGHCGDCHGGPGWTVSRMFYTPGPVNNGSLPYTRPSVVTDEQLGLLRTQQYTVPEVLRQLNPPGASGVATLRNWTPAGRTPVVHLYGTMAGDGYDAKVTHGSDQINCVLRAVGTYPSQAGGATTQGIVPLDSPIAVTEVRDDMTKLALGETGYNVPSLIGMATGAPYFHAGNARSLEETFDPAFAPHYQALARDFLLEQQPERPGQVRDLIAFLLSIDDDKPAEALDATHDLCVPAAGTLQ